MPKYSPSYAVPTNPSPQLQVALKWADALRAPGFDASELASVFSNDYSQITLPSTLNVPELHSKEKAVKFMTETMAIYNSFVITINEIMEAPGLIVLDVTAEGDTTFGIHYLNQYLYAFRVTEQVDGSHKLTYSKHFVDSKFTEGFLEATQKVPATR